MAAIDFLQKKEISTVESLDLRLDEISETALSIRTDIRISEKRIKAIDTMLSYIDRYEAAKPVYAEYAAVRYFKANLNGEKYSRNDLNAERRQLSGSVTEQTGQLQAVQADVKVLRDVRRWINQVLPPEQYRQPPELDGKKSLQSEIKGRTERIKRQQAAKSQQPTPKGNRIWNIKQAGACHFQFENDRRFFYFRMIQEDFD